MDGVSAVDTWSGNRYFNMVLSNAGGAASGYPPNQQIVAGAYGALPFSGVQWVMYCGELDPDPTLSGCIGMSAARDWVIKYGATFKLLIDDPVGDHGGFMTNSANVITALGQFDPTSTQASSDCIFRWAEGSFAQYFAPAGAVSQTALPYYYRYYLGTQNYLATKLVDQRLYAAGLSTAGTIVDLGPISGLLSTSGCTTPSAPGNVTVAQVNQRTVGSASFGSSSKLLVSWSAPTGDAIDHEEITATEPADDGRADADHDEQARNRDEHDEQGRGEDDQRLLVVPLRHSLVGDQFPRAVVEVRLGNAVIAFAEEGGVVSASSIVLPSPLAGEERLGLAACCLASLGEGVISTNPLQFRLGNQFPSLHILSRKGRGR